MQQRLNKIIASAGVTSRRNADELISNGQVKINGKVVRELGIKADPERDSIRVSGKLISLAVPKITVVLNKPPGFVSTTSDPQGRPTVMDLVRIRGRLYPVGRLDYDTSGLILITNDGELAQLLTHPSSMVPKTYEAKVRGIPGTQALKRLSDGVKISGKPTAPAKVELFKSAKDGHHSWIRICLIEGKNRQVRKMCMSVGHPVLKLKRINLGPLSLGDLPRGKFRDLDEGELKILRNSVKNKKSLK